MIKNRVGLGVILAMLVAFGALIVFCAHDFILFHWGIPVQATVTGKRSRHIYSQNTSNLWGYYLSVAFKDQTQNAIETEIQVRSRVYDKTDAGAKLDIRYLPQWPSRASAVTARGAQRSLWVSAGLGAFFLGLVAIIAIFGKNE